MSGTGYLGRADEGRTVQDLTPETLRELLLGAAEFVVVEDLASGHSARAVRESGEAWQVEVRTAGAEPVRTLAANTDATFDLLRSWAAGDDWWQEAFAWEPVAQAPPAPSVRSRNQR